MGPQTQSNRCTLCGMKLLAKVAMGLLPTGPPAHAPPFPGLGLSLSVLSFACPEAPLGSWAQTTPVPNTYC